MKFYVSLAMASVMVLLLAEVSPEAINALLILILLGTVLYNYDAFQKLFGGVVGGVIQGM